MDTHTGWSRDTNRYVAHLRAAGTPETTVYLRRYHLHRVAADAPAPPRSITKEQLVEWFAKQRHWAPNTRRSYRTTLRSFFAWLAEHGRRGPSVALAIPSVRVPRGRPRPAPEDAYRTALATAPERIQLAIALAGRCALRRGEIARTATEDVEQGLFGWCLRVRGKGGHVRLVPLPDDLADQLLNAPAGWLFPSPQGGHLTENYLGRLISAALPGALTAHTLRHRAATVALAGTKDLRAVQEFLGHSKPETTTIYTLTPDDAVRAAMLAAAA